VREVLAQAGQFLMDLGPLPPTVVLGTGWLLHREAHPDGKEQAAFNALCMSCWVASPQ
jgi:hypothetical protein